MAERFNQYYFCNKRGCKQNCLRNSSNMPYNRLVIRYQIDKQCTEEYPNLLLQKNPTNPELDEDGNLIEDWYWEYLNDEIERYKPELYIEPFVGHSKSIMRIRNVVNRFGTDENKELLESKRIECNGTPKNFQCYNYELWNKILLNKNYSGKCLVFCEPYNTDLKKFLSVAGKWAKMNKVYIRSENLKSKQVFVIKDSDYIYKL